MDEFEQFWAAYPKRRAKADARKAWAQTSHIRPTIDVLLAAIQRGRDSYEWKKCSVDGVVGAFIPLPATYLRGERWDDEYAEKRSSTAKFERQSDAIRQLTGASGRTYDASAMG